MRNVKITDEPYQTIMGKVLPADFTSMHVRFCELLDPPTLRLWFTMVSVHTPIVDQFELPDCTHV